PDGRLFQGIFQALSASFADVRVYCVGRPDRPDHVQNLMLLALPEHGCPERPEPTGPLWAANPAPAETDTMLAARYMAAVAADVPPLSDNFAPVERYALMLLRQ
ncbi:MAG: spermine synthase, partial [Desulfovibrionaceae bacterium]|nr:spermine synthase [Desulfovibrionaceae bacterium]